MHERSLAKALVDQVVEVLQARHLGRLREVRLEIGEFAGVEPILLELAFAEIALEYWDDPVELVIAVVPLTVRCLICGTTCRVKQFVFRCSQCGSGELQINSGEELRLISVRADRASSDEVDPVRESDTRTNRPSPV